MPQTRLEELLHLASENDGFVTTRSAAAVGISRRALSGMVVRGRLERVARGVYRLAHSAPTSLTGFREAILWARSHRGPSVALSHETALAILGLTDASPSQTHLTIPVGARLRRERPPRIALHRAELGANDIIMHEGLPVTSAARTARDLMAAGSLRLAADAIREARREGYVTETESRQLLSELDRHGA